MTVFRDYNSALEQIAEEQTLTADQLAMLIRDYANGVAKQGHDPQAVRRLLDGLMNDAAGFLEDMDALNERYAELAARAPREAL
jgi:hypothetical protein